MPFGDFDPADFNIDFFTGYVEGTAEGSLVIDGSAIMRGGRRRVPDVGGGRIFLVPAERPVELYAAAALKLDGRARAQLGLTATALAGLDLQGSAEALVLNGDDDDEILLLLAVAA